MKLNDKIARTKSLPEGKNEAIFWDEDSPGFGVRVRARNSRTYIFQYKLGTKNRRMKLGVVTAMTTAAARKTADKLYAMVQLGQDPAAEKAAARAKARHAFGAALQEFLASKQKHLRPSSYEDIRHGLEAHAKPLHELMLDKVTKADVATCLNTVEANAGARTRNKVRGHISGFYSWAIQESRAEINPAIGTRMAKQKTRDRVLTAEELRVIWQALPQNEFGTIMKLLALTGQRANEIADLRWSEIRGEVIELPPERTKNHRPHRIPLAPDALEIITKQERRVDGQTGEPRDLIFGSGEGGFSGWTRARVALNERIKQMTGKVLPHWTPHDLRRTFVTHTNEIGIPPHVIELCVNHVSGHRAGVAGVYNHAKLEPEKRSAMLRWADTLLEWVGESESNITPMRRPA